MDALDTLANNLANVSTVGFKERKSFFSALSVAMDSPDASQLEAAVNSLVTTGNTVDLGAGSLVETRRDLDVALEGKGFLTVETPNGLRYTRNGNLTRNAKSVLCTTDGFPVLGANGQIVLGQGKVAIGQDGQVFVDGNNVARLKLVAFAGPASLTNEGHSLFVPAQGAENPGAATGVVVRQGFQEQSNVNPVLATVRMVEILRHFEAIQKGVNLMINDMDAKVIERLGR